jgi:hypothetical protein
LPTVSRTLAHFSYRCNPSFPQEEKTTPHFALPHPDKFTKFVALSDKYSAAPQPGLFTST